MDFIQRARILEVADKVLKQQHTTASYAETLACFEKCDQKLTSDLVLIKDKIVGLYRTIEHTIQAENESFLANAHFELEKLLAQRRQLLELHAEFYAAYDGLTFSSGRAE